VPELDLPWLFRLKSLAAKALLSTREAMPPTTIRAGSPDRTLTTHFESALQHD